MSNEPVREWKISEDGYRYMVSRDEYRDIFMLRRKMMTLKAIGKMYGVSGCQIGAILAKHQRYRKTKVFKYLKFRAKRGEPMTDDLVKRLRDREDYSSSYGMTHTIFGEAAERIERLERELKQERFSREAAASRAWEFSDRIEDLQDTIARIQYTNLRRDMNLAERTKEIDKLCKTK